MRISLFCCTPFSKQFQVSLTISIQFIEVYFSTILFLRKIGELKERHMYSCKKAGSLHNYFLDPKVKFHVAIPKTIRIGHVEEVII